MLLVVEQDFQKVENLTMLVCDAEAPLSLNFLDTPSSTSQITYGVKIGHSSGSAKTLYVNRSDNDPDDLSYGRGTSTITVMEVLA